MKQYIKMITNRIRHLFTYCIIILPCSSMDGCWISSVLLSQHCCKSWQVLVHCCMGHRCEFFTQVTGQGDQHTVREQLQGGKWLFSPASCDFGKNKKHRASPNSDIQNNHLKQLEINRSSCICKIIGAFMVENMLVSVTLWMLAVCARVLYKYLEVAGVDSQPVGVESLQGLQTNGQLADVLGSLCDSQDDLPSMGQQVRWARADANVGEVGLAAWVGGEHSVGQFERFCWAKSAWPFVSVV